MINKRLVATLILTMSAATIAALVFAYGSSSQAQEAPLAQLALQASDLSPFSGQVTRSGPFAADDLSQPLNRSNGPLRDTDTSLFDYEESYSVEGVIYDGQATGYIANYLYRYAADEQSQLAVKALVEKFSAATNAKALDLSLKSPTVQEAQMFVLEGSEGDVMYWVVAAKGRTLNLLMLNGPGVSDSAMNTFSTLVVSNLER